MLILGIDPSFTSTGIVLLDDDKVLCVVNLCGKKRTIKKQKYLHFVSKVLATEIGGEDKISIPYLSKMNYAVMDVDQINGYFEAIFHILYAVFDCCLDKGLVNRSSVSIEQDFDFLVGTEIPFGFHQGAGVKIDRAFAAIVIALKSCLPKYVCKNIGVRPTEMKKFITGKGNAKKEVVMKDVYKKHGFDTNVLDISDAFAVAKYAEYKFKEELKCQKRRV